MTEEVPSQEAARSHVPTGLTLALAQQGSRVVVAGEVDLATASEFESFVRGALDAAPASLTLDLRAVTFIDSMGVRALVLMARQASSAGIFFTVFCPYGNQQVRRVLGILQLSSMMVIVAVDPDVPRQRSLGEPRNRPTEDDQAPSGPEWKVRSDVPPHALEPAEDLMRGYQKIAQSDRHQDVAPLLSTAPVDIIEPTVSRALLLRQLIRLGAEVRAASIPSTGEATGHVIVSGPDGRVVTVPPGRLSTTRVAAVVAELGYSLAEFEAVR